MDTPNIWRRASRMGVWTLVGLGIGTFDRTMTGRDVLMVAGVIFVCGSLYEVGRLAWLLRRARGDASK